MAYELFARIDLIALLIQLWPWQQHLGFDPHQGCCNQNKLAGHLHVQLFHLMDIVEEIVCDLGNRNIVDIELIRSMKNNKRSNGPSNRGSFTSKFSCGVVMRHKFIYNPLKKLTSRK